MLRDPLGAVLRLWETVLPRDAVPVGVLLVTFLTVEVPADLVVEPEYALVLPTAVPEGAAARLADVLAPRPTFAARGVPLL